MNKRSIHVLSYTICIIFSFLFYSCSSSSSAGAGGSRLSSFGDSVKQGTDSVKSVTDPFSDAVKQGQDLKSSIDGIVGGTKDSANSVAGPTNKKEKVDNAPTNDPPPNSSKLPEYGSFFDRHMGSVIKVNGFVQKNANRNFPIVIEMAFVKNLELYNNLSNILARSWFKMNDPQIVALKNENANLKYVQMTFLPEDKAYLHLVESPSGAVAALVFIRLLDNENLYPTLVNPYKDLAINCSLTDCIVSQNN